MTMMESQVREAIAAARTNLLAAKTAFDQAVALLPDKEPGIISMLYWVTYDDDYKVAFHTNESVWKTRFGIPPQAADQIGTIGLIHTKVEAVAPTKSLFDTFLVDEFLGIWTAATRSAEPPPQAPPSGLTSFMYWAKFNKAVNEEFRATPQTVMDRFSIVEGARSSINKVNANYDNAQGRDGAKDLFENYLTSEVLRTAPPPTFW